MDRSSFISLLVVGVILFLVGAGVGVYYQMQKGSFGDAAVRALSSKVIPSIVAYGQVTNISGRNITLSHNGDSLTIPVATDAQVSSFASGLTAEQDVGFGDVKKGDYINISVKLSADGSMEGRAVIILPPVGSNQ